MPKETKRTLFETKGSEKNWWGSRGGGGGGDPVSPAAANFNHTSSYLLCEIIKTSDV